MSERILIIDDEETLRESLGRLLTREGYDVTTTGTGEDALELTGSAILSDLYIDSTTFAGLDKKDFLGSALTTFELSAGGRTLRLLMGGDLGRLLD